jgi:hypothetical protein
MGQPLAKQVQMVFEGSARSRRPDGHAFSFPAFSAADIDIHE